MRIQIKFTNIIEETRLSVVKFSIALLASLEASEEAEDGAKKFQT